MSKKYQINFIYRHTKMYVQAAPQNIGKSIISIHLSPFFHHKKKRQNICRFRKIALLIPRELEVLTDRLEVVENLFLCQRLFCTSVTDRIIYSVEDCRRCRLDRTFAGFLTTVRSGWVVRFYDLSVDFRHI